MYNFCVRLLRNLRLVMFLLAGLFVMLDSVVLWPLYILIAALLPQTTERILHVDIYSKRFGVEDIFLLLYVLVNCLLLYLVICWLRNPLAVEKKLLR